MKKLKLLLIMLLVGVVLSGCSSSKLSDVYDEEILKKDAKEVVSMICNKDYDTLESKMSKEMVELGAKNQVQQGWDSISGKLGKFDSISKEGIVGNEDLATVVVVSKFENGKVQFTITYNEAMEISGLYMK
ncbi:MAG: DUF3887 domain-containing protein [Romboutsia sp.]